MKFRLLAIIVLLIAIVIFIICMKKDKPVVDPDKDKKEVATTCDGNDCNQTVYIDSHCLLYTEKGGTGTAITELNVLVGTRVCLFNESGCPITLSFDTELFGGASTSLPDSTCLRLVVGADARGKHYVLGISCDCVEGEGHTNPEVKVGEEDEGGG